MFMRHMTPLDVLVGLAAFGLALYLIDAILTSADKWARRRRR